MTPCQKLLKQEGTAMRIESMQQSSATPVHDLPGAHAAAHAELARLTVACPGGGVGAQGA